ncbi:MAG: squalene/phytoene synthase family protein [Elusimicrobiota bacterium]
MKTLDARDVAGAYAICRRLAPRSLWGAMSLRRHLCAVHAFARIVEDAADGKRALDARRRLEGLRRQLDVMDRRPARHPVLLALGRTMRELGLSREPFDEFLAAGLQDCAKTRYAGSGELLDYCRRSGAPVGRVVLQIHGYRDEERMRLCDRLGTGLRLARILRDLSIDLKRDRVYIPEEDFRESGYSEGDLRMGVVNEPFRSLMKRQWKRTRVLLEEAEPLAGMLSWPLSWRVRSSWVKGNEVLHRIHKLGFDTLRRRPTLGRWFWPRLVTGVLSSR